MPTDYTPAKITAGGLLATVLILFVIAAPDAASRVAALVGATAVGLFLRGQPKGYWAALNATLRENGSFFGRMLAGAGVVLSVAAAYLVPGDYGHKIVWAYIAMSALFGVLGAFFLVVAWVDYQVDKKYDKNLR